MYIYGDIINCATIKVDILLSYEMANNRHWYTIFLFFSQEP